jgi:hypothetical protein
MYQHLDQSDIMRFGADDQPVSTICAISDLDREALHVLSVKLESPTR